MKLLVQRVRSASVTINHTITADINAGLLVFLGISAVDTAKDCHYLIEKLIHLRLFNDDTGKMNWSVSDIKGELLIISQFTLYGDCRKGRRPSYIAAAPPEIAQPLYQIFLDTLDQRYPFTVKSGQFGAHMDVSLVNDGPVTVMVSS